MKILLINKYHYLRGGADKYYLELAELLRTHGHEVAVFSMKHPQNFPSEWDKYFINNINYDAPTNFFKKITLAFKIFYNRQASKNLEKLIQDFKPDIAHLNNIYHQLSPSIIFALKKYQIPLVMTLHDYKLICPNYRLCTQGKICEKCRGGKYYQCYLNRCAKNSRGQSLLLMLEAYLHNKFLKTYSLVDLFIAPSEFMKNICASFSVPASKIKIVRNFLNTSIKPRGDSKDYLLYFGRLSQEKGVSVLLRALAKSNNQTRTLIVGDGPEKENLITEAKNLGLTNIEFAGSLFGQELTNIIGEAKAVIVPSVWYENMPYTVIEAMFLGKTVIASNLGGIPELINNSEDGFLFNASDENDLAEKITALDKYDLKKIGERAQTKVESFSAEKHYQEIIGIYQGLLNIDKTK